MHEYDEGLSNWCWFYERQLEAFGGDAITKSGDGVNRAPLVISEWGHDESDASGSYNSNYSKCLTGWMESKALGWMVWVLAGSYYIREGTQDSDETYGRCS